MKIARLNLIFILFFSFPTFAQDKVGIESFDGIEHQNSGCPINSDCSKNNGKLMREWDAIFKTQDKKKRSEKLQAFKEKNGLPLHFLTKKEAKEKYDPILFNSRCKHHNPKNPHNSTYQGTMFFKSVPQENGILHFDSIILFEKDKKITYKVSYQDRPHFVKDDRLFFLKDHEDNFYQTSINAKGDMKLEDLNISVFTKADSRKMKEVPCPENKEDKDDLYSSTYCQKIWDMDTGEMKTIQVFWSCP